MFNWSILRAPGNYFSRAKEEQHVARGRPWTDQLQLAVRNSIAIITRGIGPGRQSASLDLAAVLTTGLPWDTESEAAREMPACGRRLFHADATSKSTADPNKLLGICRARKASQRRLQRGVCENASARDVKMNRTVRIPRTKKTLRAFGQQVPRYCRVDSSAAVPDGRLCCR